VRLANLEQRRTFQPDLAKNDMDTLILDLRYALRTLWKSKGFSVVAVVALMLGIGANTAIFSVVNAVLLRPLPYDHADRLLFLSERSQVLEGMSISYPNFLDWREQNQSFEHIGVYRRQDFVLTGGDQPVQLTGGMVSADLFDVLRARPALGRVFTNDEDKPGGAQVVVLSDALWNRRFGGDPSVIDQTITLSSKPYTVIGVMPPDFLFPSRAEFWVPVGHNYSNPGWQERGNHPGLYGVARLKDGVTIDQARADMDLVAAHLEQQYPNSNSGCSATITPLLEVFVSDARKPLMVILITVAAVLLIACANVANLLLGRAASRQREIAVRTAVGASRLRIVRQMLTESVVLSVAGGALGLIVANFGVKALVAVSPANIPRSREISLDARVLLFTLGVSVLTGIVFGLVPALQASRPDMNEILKDAGRGSTGSLKQMLRRVLVVVEVAISLVLLIAAGLLIRSFYRLYSVDPGFKVERLLTVRLTLPEARYPERQKRADFFKRVVEQASTLPGVEAAGLASGLPLGNNGNQTSFSVIGRDEPPPGQRPLMEVVQASADYFKTMGIPLVKGRTFTDADTANAPRVMVIDETFAERHWPGEEALGKQIRAGGPQEPPTTVVGIVKRVRMESLSSDSNRVQAYFHYTVNTWNGMALVLRTSVDPASLTSSVREVVRSIDPDQPIFNVRTVENIRDDSVAPQRMNMMLLTVFAALAAVLAAVGIYGVMAYSVAQRTHEIGIRMALGAARTDVLRLVVGQGMALTALGVGIGLAGAFALTRFMATMLFGISAVDLPTFVAITALLSAVALAACAIPARRAANVDPIIALRYE